MGWGRSIETQMKLKVYVVLGMMGWGQMKLKALGLVVEAWRDAPVGVVCYEGLKLILGNFSSFFHFFLVV